MPELMTPTLQRALDDYREAAARIGARPAEQANLPRRLTRPREEEVPGVRRKSSAAQGASSSTQGAEWGDGE